MNERTFDKVRKRLLVYILILGSSLMLVGIVGARFVEMLDQAYSQVISSGTPLLLTSKNLTQSVAAIVGAAGQLEHSKSETDRARIVEAILRQEQVSRNCLLALDAVKTSGNAAEVKNLRHLYELFDAEVKRAILEARPEVEVVSYAKVLEAASAYLVAENQFGINVANSLKDASDLVTTRAVNLRRFLYLLAFWPLVVGLLVVGYVIGSIAVIFLRGRTGTVVSD